MFVVDIAQTSFNNHKQQLSLVPQSEIAKGAFDLHMTYLKRQDQFSTASSVLEQLRMPEDVTLNAVLQIAAATE